MYFFLVSCLQGDEEHDYSRLKRSNCSRVSTRQRYLTLIGLITSLEANLRGQKSGIQNRRRVSRISSYALLEPWYAPFIKIYSSFQCVGFLSPSRVSNSMPSAIFLWNLYLFTWRTRLNLNMVLKSTSVMKGWLRQSSFARCYLLPRIRVGLV